jgi:hypothetical protein
MARSKVVAALALVVALSFAVPALAGKSSPIKIAKKALGLSKKADKRSRTALKRANTANANATAALTKASAPVTEAAHAANADHSTNADHATNADAAKALEGLTVLGRVKVQPTSGPDFDTARANAPEIPLFSHGPLRVYAKCLAYVDGNPRVDAQVYIGTSQDGVIFGSSVDDDSGNGYLNDDTPEVDRQLHVQASQDAVGSLNAGSAGAGEFYAFAPDGSVLQGHVYLAVKQGDPAVGDGPIGPGSGCVFTGRAYGS